MTPPMIAPVWLEEVVVEDEESGVEVDLGDVMPLVAVLEEAVSVGEGEGCAEGDGRAAVDTRDGHNIPSHEEEETYSFLCLHLYAHCRTL